MPDFRQLYDKEFLYHYDLPTGQDVTVTIEKCVGGEVTGTGGKKNKKPILSFVGKAKKLALCVTSGRVIAQLYGNKTEGWVGKRIALYTTTTSFGSQTVECIRIRPKVPGDKQDGSFVAAPVDEAT